MRHFKQKQQKGFGMVVEEKPWNMFSALLLGLGAMVIWQEALAGRLKLNYKVSDKP